jgi:hypothetical protein
MMVFGVAGLLAYFGNTFFGLTVAIGILLDSKRAVSLDPRIYRLAALSLRQKAYYDQESAGEPHDALTRSFTARCAGGVRIQV